MVSKAFESFHGYIYVEAFKKIPNKVFFAYIRSCKFKIPYRSNLKIECSNKPEAPAFKVAAANPKFSTTL
jgi:hypothetical protein